MKFFIIVVIYINWIAAAQSENSSSEYPELQPIWPYCFAFTWFGPDYDNVTNRYNDTCSDYLEETRAKGIPCTPPIVISYDGTPPDMNYLWDNHKASILCKRSITQRCVKYVYYQNNIVRNITYSCAGVHYEDGGEINNGCYKQKLHSGYETEACICESSTGIYPPCNKVSLTKIPSYFLLAPVSVIFFLYSTFLD